jgi:hypothetical protein
MTMKNDEIPTQEILSPPRTSESILLPHFTTSLLMFFLVWLIASPLHAAPLVLHDQVISTNTEWSGEILIDGVVVVGRQATLSIAPGTKILFEKIDRNGDGVGDAEIRVLGTIRAEGRPDAKIVFASAAAQPAPKDWSYLLIFTSPAINYISWCEFHHGFSGIQVHFSTLTVENSDFTYNHEGLRFGRADLKIAGNLFANNDIGIRFTRMEGPVSIIGNDIRNNRIGLFLVPSGQNIRDFFEPDRSGTPWNTGHLQISGNNIYANTWYNLDLGEKQLWDLEISENYWGFIDSTAIAETIFDHRRDETLGRALFKPFSPIRLPNRATSRSLAAPNNDK